MISPSLGLTATERVLPRLALDFTTASLDARITFTRSGNTATVTNSSGVIAAINADLPRFDYDPTTLVCKGLLIEEARTNLLTTSKIDGTVLVTQIVATTAVAHTLSFYGTGSIVLSGTSVATVTGTGAYPSRKTLTFTPTVGALTLTVSGTVQYAQLEIGGFATSFIPTTIATTRNADNASMTGTNFSSWYNATANTFFAQWSSFSVGAGTNPMVFTVSDGTTNNLSQLYINGSTSIVWNVRSGAADSCALINAASISGTTYKASTTSALNSFAASLNSLAPSTDNTGAVPVSPDRMGLGNRVGSLFLNGYLQKLSVYPQRLINAELQATSK